jgi:hypothetical protein
MLPASTYSRSATSTHSKILGATNGVDYPFQANIMNFVGRGSVSHYSHGIFPKLIAMYEAIDIAHEPHLHNHIYYNVMGSLASPVFSWAGVTRHAMLRLIRAVKATFVEAEATAEILCEGPVKYSYFVTDEFQYSPKSYFIEQARYRHWLAAGDTFIEREAFKESVPAADAQSRFPIDVTCNSCSMFNGGCQAEVFGTLGMYEDGIRAAAIDIANNPYNPCMQILSPMAIGRCQSQLGRPAESKAAFGQALFQAKRLKFRLLQLLVVRDCMACNVSGNSAEDVEQLLLDTQLADTSDKYRSILSIVKHAVPVK